MKFKFSVGDRVDVYSTLEKLYSGVITNIDSCVSDFFKKPYYIFRDSKSGGELCIPEHCMCYSERVMTNVIFNDPATIVFWSDGTKTVVKAGKNETFDPEKGLAMAIAKKYLGNNGNYYEVFKKWLNAENINKKTNKPVADTTQDGGLLCCTCANLGRGVDGKVCGNCKHVAFRGSFDFWRRGYPVEKDHTCENCIYELFGLGDIMCQTCIHDHDCWVSK